MRLSVKQIARIETSLYIKDIHTESAYNVAIITLPSYSTVSFVLIQFWASATAKPQISTFLGIFTFLSLGICYRNIKDWFHPVSVSSSYTIGSWAAHRYILDPWKFLSISLHNNVILLPGNHLWAGQDDPFVAFRHRNTLDKHHIILISQQWYVSYIHKKWIMLPSIMLWWQCFAKFVHL